MVQLKLFIISLILHALSIIEGKADRLESYNVDQNKVSISGISSGAAMATQMHVIHSADFMGVGIIAGVPFACSGGNLVGALACMQTPNLESVSSFERLTSSGAFLGNVDSTYHMRHDKVYIFAGQSDSVVKPGNGPNIQRYYNHYTLHSNVKTVFNINAEHGQPTDNYGGTCNVLSKSNYLNNCGYNAAFELLNWIYGDLKVPEAGKPLTGQLKTFDQSTFFHLSVPITYSFDNDGYIYVPSGCADKQTKCKLHIALHGCQQGRHFINDEYVKHAGYNEVGEANNIIILYPQITPIPTNLNGCWDWFGYTGAYFATKSGFQITALDRMRRQVIGQ
ncbi:unnamed protein product [Mytilus coruscus]|uniref:Poly(3-hydroxybutyrate) depolymerase n=1 Tax=Mytilus coruscus TaxID=42192 RepID=A0A6J8EJ42_MYTCO|nr:unnamed protein product [Mytilus coruscus]